MGTGSTRSLGTRPAGVWADFIGLGDSTRGARTINANLYELSQRGINAFTPQPPFTGHGEELIGQALPTTVQAVSVAMKKYPPVAK